MESLVADMVQNDPTKRPTMDEAVLRLDQIVKQLSSWKLRSRIIDESDGSILRFYHGAGYWARRISYVFKRTSAIPTYR